jgi:hypothetical protein
MYGTFQVSAFTYDRTGSSDAAQFAAAEGELACSQPPHCGSSDFELHLND